ncbi:AraC family ligand binding domain-containing protein [Streptomyces yunnanensis]|uniref:AraC family ligand binding domain-containing protein n=1 Tax=Streptomyces yunnanensis TaxID=156453 RepID=A0ABY8AK54_9ACTN|nr:AraC family ligand binding domain-containing protein [Streptomyces yunnanensis]WEB45414.1 AraC family ligand binding domain-containing protein [Streptomyces yunnanensis]
MTPSGERAAYWRVPGLAPEALDARFERYAYPMHAHDTYSFGVTDDGAQSFVCRGGRHVSAAGLAMAFNPDDPHDGQSAVRDGYRYRMLHLGEDQVRGILADAAPGTAGLPLFDTPVVDNPALARGAAAEAGFADQAHLTRWFTRTYGITPAAYRTA